MLCIYVMVSDGEIVGNMFKESLDSVQSFDIFCRYEKQRMFPTCSYHFQTNVGAFLLGFPPSTKSYQICHRDVATFGLPRCETPKKTSQRKVEMENDQKSSYFGTTKEVY